MELHPLFIQAFGGDKELLAWAQTLRESWTRWFAQSIEEPKSEEARDSDEAAGKVVRGGGEAVLDRSYPGLPTSIEEAD